MPLPRSHRSILALALALLGLASPAPAKPPTLSALFPAGGQRGQTIAVTAVGSFENWPLQGWASAPGIEVKAAEAKGQLSITIASEVVPGLYWLRLYDGQGATEARPFVVGTLPEVNEVEPNDDPSRPQALDSSTITINGRLAKAGDVDGFALRLAKGQTLVASMEANRRLGSPMDGVLQVVSPEGFVLAQNDDDHDRDPQIIFEAPGDGTYLVRTFAFPAKPDSAIRFAGGESFVYRLALTTEGFLDHAFPLAVPRDAPGQVEAIGWNIPEAARVLPVLLAGAAETAWVTHPLLANSAEVRLVPHAAIAETEPNDAAHPQAISTPITISGRIDRPGDVDGFQFTAKKGEALVFRIESRRLGHPLDPVLRLMDSAGKVLSEVDDSGQDRDAELPFTPPAEGTYRLSVRDRNDQGGLRYVYRLSATPPERDFALTLGADRFTLSPGKPLTIPVTIERKGGFAEAITISLEDPPAGLSADPVVSLMAGGDAAKKVALQVTATADARSGPIRICGRVGDGPARAARAPLAGFNTAIESIWLTIPEPDRDEKTP
ncbi:MAG: pre-peptidase C-terminal domain-containing protein [Isosphaeraceae bacterium]|nr:pre-peptidase C-terminal domain-containing protein [Isosphaeraceae bacterium]